MATQPNINLDREPENWDLGIVGSPASVQSNDGTLKTVRGKGTKQPKITREDTHIRDYMHKNVQDISVKRLRCLVPQLLAVLLYGPDTLQKKKKNKGIWEPKNKPQGWPNIPFGDPNNKPKPGRDNLRMMFTFLKAECLKKYGFSNSYSEPSNEVTAAEDPQIVFPAVKVKVEPVEGGGKDMAYAPFQYGEQDHLKCEDPEDRAMAALSGDQGGGYTLDVTSDTVASEFTHHVMSPQIHSVAVPGEFGQRQDPRPGSQDQGAALGPNTCTLLSPLPTNAVPGRAKPAKANIEKQLRRLQEIRTALETQGDADCLARLDNIIQGVALSCAHSDISLQDTMEVMQLCHGLEVALLDEENMIVASIRDILEAARPMVSDMEYAVVPLNDHKVPDVAMEIQLYNAVESGQRVTLGHADGKPYFPPAIAMLEGQGGEVKDAGEVKAAGEVKEKDPSWDPLKLSVRSPGEVLSSGLKGMSLAGVPEPDLIQPGQTFEQLNIRMWKKNNSSNVGPDFVGRFPTLQAEDIKLEVPEPTEVEAIERYVKESRPDLATRVDIRGGEGWGARLGGLGGSAYPGGHGEAGAMAVSQRLLLHDVSRLDDIDHDMIEAIDAMRSVEAGLISQEAGRDVGQAMGDILDQAMHDSGIVSEQMDESEFGVMADKQVNALTQDPLVDFWSMQPGASLPPLNVQRHLYEDCTPATRLPIIPTTVLDVQDSSSEDELTHKKRNNARGKAVKRMNGHHGGKRQRTSSYQ